MIQGTRILGERKDARPGLLGLGTLRLTLPLVLVVVLAVLVMAIMDYRSSSAMLMDSILENQTRIAQEINRTVEHAIENTKETANLVASLNSVQEVLNGGHKATQASRLALQDLLSRMVRESGELASITVYSVAGLTVADSQGKVDSVEHEPFFIRATEGLMTLDAHVQENGQAELFFVKALTDGTTFIGAVKVGFDLYTMRTAWRDIIPPDKGYRARVTGRHGEILSSSYDLEVGEFNVQKMPIHSIFASPPGTLLPFEEKGTERLGMYLPIGQTDMRVVIGVNKSAAFARLNTLFQQSIVINVVATMCILAVMLYMQSQLVRTIRKLEMRNQHSLLQANKELESQVAERTRDLNVRHRDLEIQHENLMRILQTSPIGISIASHEGLVLYCNPAAKNIFGDDQGAVHPDRIYQNLSHRDKIIQWLLRGKQVSNYPVSMYTGNGEACSMLVSATALHYQGQEAGLCWFVDVTEMQLARKELEAERTLLRTVFDTIPDFISYKSLRGEYQACNKAFASFWGKSPQEVLKTTEKQLLSHLPEKAQDKLLTDRQVLETGLPLRVDESLQKANGTSIDVETLKTACVSESGEILGILSICRDITQRKAMEVALVRAREEAQAASQTKSNFLANMSHEIRTPMNGIMGLTHLALQVEKVPGQLRNYLENIDISAKSLLRIINDILDFSKIEAGKLEMESVPFVLEAVLENVVQPIMPSICAKGLELLLELDQNLPSDLLGDPTRLGQVLINLLGNAVKFTHEGSIVISVARKDSTEGSLNLAFEVRDTGIGMDEHYLHRMFESFSQADTSITRRYGGTGLGLSISRSLVGLMGGEIRVNSQLGKGTVFAFNARFGVLPAKEAMRSVPVLPSSLRILVADDNEISRRIMQASLQGVGASIDLAASGREAIVFFQQSLRNNKPYDVVILDWRMPEIDGMETARHIQKHMPWGRVPLVIMVTAHERELLRKEALEAGVVEVLTKPVTPSLLHDTIARMCAPHASSVGLVSCSTMDSQKAEQGQVFGPDAHKPDVKITDVEKPGLDTLGLDKPETTDKVSMSTASSKVLEGCKVLLAEDNDINQLIATEILEQFGCFVRVVSNGLEAVALARQQSFDLILMDIQMPEMDGFVATEHIRATPGLESVPIVAMTAHAMTGDADKSLKAGMQAHLTKPINPQELFDTIKQWYIPKASR